MNVIIGVVLTNHAMMVPAFAMEGRLLEKSNPLTCLRIRRGNIIGSNISNPIRGREGLNL